MSRHLEDHRESSNTRDEFFEKNNEADLKRFYGLAPFNSQFHIRHKTLTNPTTYLDASICIGRERLSRANVNNSKDIRNHSQGFVQPRNPSPACSIASNSSRISIDLPRPRDSFADTKLRDICKRKRKTQKNITNI